jgi:hypothetical protein
MFAEHFGPSLISATGAPAGVRTYASRDLAGTITKVIVVNWNNSDLNATFTINGTPAAVAPFRLTLGARSFSAVEIPDTGAPPAVWTYGPAQFAAHTPAARLTATAQGLEGG